MPEKLIHQVSLRLGKKARHDDNGQIPGVVNIPGVEVVYFLDDGKTKFNDQFSRLTYAMEPSCAQNGGVNERGCSILLPGGLLFHAIGYHGDLEGWREDITQQAKKLQISLAKIENGILLKISDGEEFALSECEIIFY